MRKNKDEPENLILRIVQDIRADQLEMKDRIFEMGERMTAMEIGIGSINHRMDRLERDVDYIKKRLDLVEA